MGGSTGRTSAIAPREKSDTQLNTIQRLSDDESHPFAYVPPCHAVSRWILTGELLPSQITPDAIKNGMVCNFGVKTSVCMSAGLLRRSLSDSNETEKTRRHLGSFCLNVSSVTF
jgi:hypothetical protein